MVEPTGYSALDLIGFTDRGPYAANVNYVKNDLVHHGGNIWRVLIDDTMGITPTEGVNYTVFIGEPTNLVERIIAPLETNPATIGYTTGRQIIYNDYLYEVIADIAIGDSLITYEADPTNANIKLAPPVETQLLAVKAEADATDNMIAPTEASDSSSSAPYSVGDQLILNNILYDVIAAIQIGDALTTGTGGNIKAADNLTDQLKEVDSQIQTLTNNDDVMLNVLGAKNLLPNNATSQIVNGVTFTVKSDGSVTVSGTATDTAYIDLYIPTSSISAFDAILSGCPSGGGANSYEILATLVISGTPTYYRDYGDGVTIPKSASGQVSQVNIDVRVLVRSGVTINQTFRPMIRPASVSNDTYVPYAMTNRKLTDDLNDNSLSSVTSSYGTIEGGYKKIGKIVIVNIRLTANTTIPSGSFIIEGLPPATGTLNKVAFTTSVQQTTAILNTTVIQLTTAQSLASGTILILSGTYVSNK